MYHLLIADDDLGRRKWYERLRCRFEGQLQIFQASDIEEAFRKYQEEQVEIVLLDVKLSGMQGMRLAEQLRADSRRCCIIFFTEMQVFEYARKAVSLGAFEYLLKPCSKEQMFSVIERAMQALREDVLFYGQRAARRQLQEQEEKGRLKKTVELIQRYIEEHYAEDISTQDIAAYLNYSEAYFCRLFKQCFGESFTVYLTAYRIDAAKRLLEQPVVNVREIGRAVGYRNPNYFSKLFKKSTGQNPTEYHLENFKGGGRAKADLHVKIISGVCRKLTLKYQTFMFKRFANLQTVFLFAFFSNGFIKYQNNTQNVKILHFLPKEFIINGMNGVKGDRACGVR